MDIQPTTLNGQTVSLVPLSYAHVPQLTVAAQDEEIWRYMLYGAVKNSSDMQRWVEDIIARQARGTDLAFTVILKSSQTAVGATRYLNIQPEHRGLEIGGTWYARPVQRSAVNTECKYLLLQHAFESLGAIRVQFKTDALNLRSQRAIERIGARKEGILRKHMITPEGRQRDSVYYSILDDEWPAVKRSLEQKLAAYPPPR